MKPQNGICAVKTFSQARCEEKGFLTLPTFSIWHHFSLKRPRFLSCLIALFPQGIWQRKKLVENTRFFPFEKTQYSTLFCKHLASVHSLYFQFRSEFVPGRSKCRIGIVAFMIKIHRFCCQVHLSYIDGPIFAFITQCSRYVSRESSRSISIDFSSDVLQRSYFS